MVEIPSTLDQYYPGGPVKQVYDLLYQLTSTGIIGGLEHVQTVPALTWVIVHNFGHRPLAQAFNTAGDLMLCAVHHDSDNQCTLSFNSLRAGRARVI